MPNQDIYIPLNKRKPDEQPRERLAKYGAQQLKTSELIALILRSGSSGKSAVDLGDKMLRQYGDDLGHISTLSLNEIKSNDGFGTASGCALAAAFELGRRAAYGSKKQNEYNLKKISDVANLFRREYGSDAPEKFAAFYINRKHRLLGQKLISKGSSSKTVVDPREIFKEALLLNASALILAHNHPEGNLIPSNHDISLTREMIEAGRIFRIPIAEHIIITSRAEAGTLDLIQENCLSQRQPRP